MWRNSRSTGANSWFGPRRQRTARAPNGRRGCRKRRRGRRRCAMRRRRLAPWKRVLPAAGPYWRAPVGLSKTAKLVLFHCTYCVEPTRPFTSEDYCHEKPRKSLTDAVEAEAGGSRCRGQRSRLGLERPYRAAAFRRRLGRTRFDVINLRHARRIDRPYVPQIPAANCGDRAQIAHRAGIGAYGRLSCSRRSLRRVLVQLDRSTWLCSRPYADARCQPRQPAGRTSRLCVVGWLRRACEGEQREHPCREAQERCDKDPQVEESAAKIFCFHGVGLRR